MLSFLQKLFRPRLIPLNKITIAKNHILYNLGYLQGLRPQLSFFPVLKSNAYGHGLKEMTQILEAVSVPYLIVDSLPEYFLARKYTKKKFLLLSETNPANYMKIHTKRVSIVVYTLSTLKYLLTLGKKFTIHLFLNTGMNREGLQEKDLYTFLELLKTHENRSLLKIEGVVSHFVASEDTDQVMMRLQVERFKQMHFTILNYGHVVKWRHISNSAAVFSLQDDFFNAARVGLSLYGYNPFAVGHPCYEQAAKLQPALRIVSSVISIHEIPKTEGVSYNHTWLAKQKTKIATIPFGYKEGLPRSASSGLVFRCHDQVVQQVGTICMNLCSFDCGKNDIAIGDPVELVSFHAAAPNAFSRVAAAAGTIIRECLVRLDPAIRREIVDGDTGT